MFIVFMFRTETLVNKIIFISLTIWRMKGECLLMMMVRCPFNICINELVSFLSILHGLLYYFFFYRQKIDKYRRNLPENWWIISRGIMDNDSVAGVYLLRLYTLNLNIVSCLLEASLREAGLLFPGNVWQTWSNKKKLVCWGLYIVRFGLK